MAERLEYEPVPFKPSRRKWAWVVLYLAALVAVFLYAASHVVE